MKLSNCRMKCRIVAVEVFHINTDECADRSVVRHDAQNSESPRKLQTKLHYVVRETVSNFRSLEGVGDSLERRWRYQFNIQLHALHLCCIIDRKLYLREMLKSKLKQKIKHHKIKNTRLNDKFCNAFYYKIINIFLVIKKKNYICICI